MRTRWIAALAGGLFTDTGMPLHQARRRLQRGWRPRDASGGGAGGAKPRRRRRCLGRPKLRDLVDYVASIESSAPAALRAGQGRREAATRGRG
jgi:hypothetical protein